MSSTVEQIKSKLNIVDLVGSYLKLERAGGNLKARCPFHNEKTPSFFVSPARDSFHCFGCNKGGDIFEFVKEIEGVEFVDALKILAEKAGVRIQKEDASAKSEKGRLISVMEAAVSFFEHELLRNQPAIDYLVKRGLTKDTIRLWRIGFAPDSWRGVYDYLRQNRFTDSEIERAGLTIRSPKGYYDRFRSRIMFPINNISGTPVGFSGRIFSLSPANSRTGQEPAKYINSPQTELYDKSKILFGFDRSRVAIRTSDACILVEGQMDLVMSHQAGRTNTVAVSGTALTEEHIRNIKRLASRVIFAFDGDEAGFKAARRGVDMALIEGMDVRAAKVPLGVDPADLILSDPDKWNLAVDEAKHVVDFYIDTLCSRGYEPRVLIAEMNKHVLPYIKKIKSSIEQSHFVNAVARRLGVEERSVWEDLGNINVDQGETTKDRFISKEEDKRGTIAGVSRADNILARIVGIIWWQGDIGTDSGLIDKREGEVRKITGEGKYALTLEVLKAKRDSLIFEAEVSFGGGANTMNVLDELIADLKEETLKNDLNGAIARLRRAESSGNSLEIEECLRLASDLSRELAKVKGGSG